MICFECGNELHTKDRYVGYTSVYVCPNCKSLNYIPDSEQRPSHSNTVGAQ